VVSFGLNLARSGTDVETFGELAYLQAATRIRYAQGFYYAKAFFLDGFTRTCGAAGDSRAVPLSRGPAETRGARTSTAVGARHSRSI
jgi:c-di-GMP phosphodiesterase Gmr